MQNKAKIKKQKQNKQTINITTTATFALHKAIGSGGKCAEKKLH